MASPSFRLCSNPTSYCFCRVSGLRVEAESRVRSMFMHEVNQFLKQDEVSWNHADARANHDAVELLLFELGQNDRFRSLAKIGQANARVVANRLQTFLIGGHSRHHSCGVHAGKGGEGGVRKIDQCGIQADKQHTLPGCSIGMLRRGLSFSVHIFDVGPSAMFLDGMRRNA